MAGVTTAQDIQALIQAYLDRVTTGTYADALRANEERVQARLVILGYELCGGTDKRMIARAAQAIEMLHAAMYCLEEGSDEYRARRGLHEAEIILANLDADAELKIKVLSITNRTLMLAAQAAEDPTNEQAMFWRATEAALNPLHVGMVLAGADCHATDAVTPAALAYGEALVRNTPHSFETFTEKVRQCLLTVGGGRG